MTPDAISSSIGRVVVAELAQDVAVVLTEQRRRRRCVTGVRAKWNGEPG